LLQLFGYLDPGTGSLLVQSLVGVLAGVAIFGRKAIGSLGRSRKRSEDAEDE